MNDDSLMPFGIHKGKKLSEVPGQYFLWLDRNHKIKDVALKKYIDDNRIELQKRTANFN